MSHHIVADVDAPELHCISADHTIEDALEEMFETGNPQLGVIEDGAISGVISHREITRVLHFNGQIDQEGSFLERPVTTAVNRAYESVHPDDDLFVLFDALADDPYVLVENGTHPPQVLRDVGFHQFLKDELEEFLLIEEIERTLRGIIRDAIDDVETRLQETFESQDLRTPDRLEECSFRHYSILISSQWDVFEPRFDNKPDFVRELIDRVGDIRNQMFHFRGAHEADTLDTDFIEFARERLDHTYRNGE